MSFCSLTTHVCSSFYNQSTNFKAKVTINCKSGYLPESLISEIDCSQVASNSDILLCIENLHKFRKKFSWLESIDFFNKIVS